MEGLVGRLLSTLSPLSLSDLACQRRCILLVKFLVPCVIAHGPNARPVVRECQAPPFRFIRAECT